MRIFLASCLFLMPRFAAAQADAAAQAAQQAAEQAQQAAMQAMRDAEEANRMASQAAQQANQDVQNASLQPCCLYLTAPPKFSAKSGKYSKPITVKIKDATRGAVVYYTTDGWTPTMKSTRYRGPIVIDSTTTLLAIAIAPYSMRSMVTSAQYIISGAPTTAAAVIAPGAKNVVRVPLLFDAEVSSTTASVGDKVPLILAEEVALQSMILKKGTRATATIVQVDRKGLGGVPGTITFEVDPIETPNGLIELRGGATREGRAKPPNAAVLIPIVGGLAVFRHGEDAVIAKGTPFTAYFDKDTVTGNAVPAPGKASTIGN